MLCRTSPSRAAMLPPPLLPWSISKNPTAFTQTAQRWRGRCWNLPVRYVVVHESHALMGSVVKFKISDRHVPLVKVQVQVQPQQQQIQEATSQQTVQQTTEQEIVQVCVFF